MTINIEKSEIVELINAVKQEITPQFRAYEEDETPGIQLTIATTDGEDWTYQTGDNSFSGPCYFYHLWAVGGVYEDTDANDLADDLLDQLADQEEPI